MSYRPDWWPDHEAKTWALFNMAAIFFILGGLFFVPVIYHLVRTIAG